MTKKSNYKHLIEDMGLTYFLSNYRNLLCKIDDTYYSIIGAAGSVGADVIFHWDENHNDVTRHTPRNNNYGGASHNLTDYELFNFVSAQTNHTLDFEYRDRYVARPTSYDSLLELHRTAERELRVLEEHEPERYQMYEDEDGDMVECEDTCDEWWNWEDDHTTLEIACDYYNRFMLYLDINDMVCAPPPVPVAETQPSAPEEEPLEKLYIVCRKVHTGSEYEYIHVSKFTSLAQFPRFRKTINFPPLKKLMSYSQGTRGLSTDELMFKWPELFINPKYPTDLKSVIDQMRGTAEGEFNGWESVVMQNGMVIAIEQVYTREPYERTERIRVSMDGETVAHVTMQGAVKASKTFIHKFLQKGN